MKEFVSFQAFTLGSICFRLRDSLVVRRFGGFNFVIVEGKIAAWASFCNGLAVVDVGVIVLDVVLGINCIDLKENSFSLAGSEACHATPSNFRVETIEHRVVHWLVLRCDYGSRQLSARGRMRLCGKPG